MSTVFVDVEASTLKVGYPIEVGWAWIQGREVYCERHLIRPTSLWVESRRWDPAAERVIGFSVASVRDTRQICCGPANGRCQSVAPRGGPKAGHL
jgi:hypothetical protein